jgi:hypothetical protein
VGHIEHDVLGGQQHGIALGGHLRALAEDGAAVGTNLPRLIRRYAWEVLQAP